MKCLLFLSFLVPLSLFGQANDMWYSYRDADEYLIGYKNAAGDVMITPRFMGTTCAGKFDKVIAVTEETDSTTWEDYYLLKNGHKFGHDSVYIFDLTNACESEGFIKFRDPITDLVGLFNAQGKVAIPAEYSDISTVRNGYFVVLKDATKTYWEGDEHVGCNHWSWTGGGEFLLDTTNTVIVENFNLNSELNFYSLTITKEKNTDPFRENFLGVDGRYYSFVNNSLFFLDHFNTLLSNLTREHLHATCLEQIKFSNESGWDTLTREAFLDKYSELINKRFKSITKGKTEYEISFDVFAWPPDEAFERFDDITDNCGNLNSMKYPVMNVIVTHRNKKGKFLFQDHFDFILLENEYKLFEVTLRNT